MAIALVEYDDLRKKHSDDLERVSVSHSTTLHVLCFLTTMHSVLKDITILVCIV